MFDLWGENSCWIALVIKLVVVEVADDAEGFIILVVLTPGTLIMPLAALDWLVPIDVALVSEADGQPDTHIGQQELKVDWPAALSGHCEFPYLWMDW